MKKFPKLNSNKILGIILLLGIVFSVITMVRAVAPNPGHTISEIGNVVQGDILYGSGTDVISALAKNITATRYLSNTGASNNPAWAQVDLTNGVTGILPAGNGGTGNAFFTVSGPATAIKTFTFPNVSATVLTTNAAVTVAQGGTGLTATADDAVFVGDSASAVTARVLPTCSGATTDKLLYNISTNTFSCGVDQGGSGSSPVTVKALSATQTSSSVTPAKVTGLDQVAGVGTYVFQYFIRYRSSVAATGVRFDVNHSGTVTSFVWNQRYSNLIATASDSNADQDSIIAAGVTGSMFASRAKGTAGRGTTLSVDTINADMLVIIEGIMVVTVSGDLQLYFGSEAIGSTQSIMQDSSLILTKIL